MPLGTRVILAPGEVRPGHIMLAPLKMNFIAPLSTCILGSINGSAKESHTHTIQIYRKNEIAHESIIVKN